MIFDVDDFFRLIGQKEVEIQTLRKMLAEQQPGEDKQEAESDQRNQRSGPDTLC